MIYLLTIILFLLGVGFHVLQVMDRVKKKFPQYKLSEVFDTYCFEEFNTLLRSALVLCTYQLFLFILDMAEVQMPGWWDKYLVVYGLALVLGYAGQRLAYKYLGTAEKVLSDRADDLNNKF